MASASSSGSSAGLPRGVHVGPLGARFVGYLIDHVLPGVVIVAAVLLSGRTGGSRQVLILLLAAVLVLAWGVLVGWMYAVRTAGPGMRLMKLQLVGLNDGRAIGWGRFLLRWLVLTVLTATGIGLLLMIVFLVLKPRRQGWHDLVANSVVIKERGVASPRPSAPATTARRAEPARLQPAASGRGGERPVEQVGTRSPSVAVAERSTGEVADEARPTPPADPSGGAEGDTPTRVVAMPPTEAPVQQEGWAAVLDDGRTIEVTGLVLLGRNPTARPGEEDAQLIKIGDESRTVSKTHLALGVDANGLWVMDRGSTNGSTLTTKSGVSSRCEAGAVVVVEPESIVSFGDHWLRARHG